MRSVWASGESWSIQVFICSPAYGSSRFILHQGHSLKVDAWVEARGMLRALHAHFTEYAEGVQPWCSIGCIGAAMAWPGEAAEVVLAASGGAAGSEVSAAELLYPPSALHRLHV